MFNLINLVKEYMKPLNKQVRDNQVYAMQPTVTLLEVVNNANYHDTCKVFINGIDVAFVEPTGEIMQLNDGTIISQWHILINKNGFIVDTGEYAWDDTIVEVVYPEFKPLSNVWETYIEGMNI